MAAAAVCLRSGRQRRIPLPRFNLDRPDLIQWLTNPRTPSVGIFAKETLRFLVIEPAVQSVFQRIRVFFLKTYFPIYRFKLKLHLITVWPLPFIAYNFFVLTPN